MHAASRRVRGGRALLATALWALALGTGASALGLAANAIRPDGLRLVAIRPYDHDCPEKIADTSPLLAPMQALALARQGRALFLDARPAEDFQRRRIAGARSLPYSFVTPPTAGSVAGLRDRPALVVYCDSPGDRLAALLAAQLRELGLDRVRLLQGGLDAYQRAGGRLVVAPSASVGDGGPASEAQAP